MLTKELERARLINRGEARKNLVCMGSDILFRDDVSKQIRRITLVFPGDADNAQNKVSVLTPIGAALIGLRAGQSITWQTRTGDSKRLTVLKIIHPSDHTRLYKSRRSA